MRAAAGYARPIPGFYIPAKHQGADTREKTFGVSSAATDLIGAQHD
jgi:hypothetical protein